MSSADQQEAIVSYLRERYQPCAIIVHGSRALGKHRPHSDWDLFLLFQDSLAGQPALGFKREEIAGADVEWRAQRLPVADDRLLDTFGVLLQFARVLWEAAGSGTALVAQAARVYAQGITIPAAERPTYRQFLVHKVHGMVDDRATPYMFLRHLSEFFTRAVNWWFELRGVHRKPFYVAMPHIEAADPHYHALLLVLCGEASPEAKISAGNQIIEKIFPENR